MAQRSPLAQLLSPAIPILAVSLGAIQLFAQTAPTRILACESTNDSCKRPDATLDLVWVFNGIDGTATSPANPAGSRITIEKFDSNSIVLRRVDETGPTAGLTAVYTGTVNGTHMIGTVQRSWPSHPDYPATAIFSAILQDQLAANTQTPATSSTPQSFTTQDALPTELLVCENNNVCNAAWLIHGAEGTGVWFARNPTKARLAVIRSAPDDILIRRTDTTDSVSANYAGRLRGDHYAGTIIFSTPGHPGEVTGTWTATVPKTTCDPHAGLEPADAMHLGQTALMFHRDHEALDCYIVAARAGDATAQTAVGLTYYQGRENVPQDYTQAFFWLHKAADQGIYAAQRTVAEMYAAGQGTSRDATLAAIYTKRADEQKHDLERQQDRQYDAQQRAADRGAQILSSFVLGASFGLFF
jgi:hypothetical protein